MTTAKLLVCGHRLVVMSDDDTIERPPHADDAGWCWRQVPVYADAEVLSQSVLEAWSSMANAEMLQHFDGIKVKLVFFKQQVEVERDDVAVVCQVRQPRPDKAAHRLRLELDALPRHAVCPFALALVRPPGRCWFHAGQRSRPTEDPSRRFLRPRIRARNRDPPHSLPYASCSPSHRLELSATWWSRCRAA
jgi:hypothetical protein